MVIDIAILGNRLGGAAVELAEVAVFWSACLRLGAPIP